MREYIFRGKRTDNGGWAEGYLWVLEGVPQIFVPFTEEDKSKNYTISAPLGGWWHIVVPESVGEWTGLIDNNGRKIFEGDIVRCQKRFDRPYSDKRKSKRHIGIVKYQVRGSHFDYAAEWIVEVEDYGKFVHGAWGDFYDCEVIGTVFENADLLEE